MQPAITVDSVSKRFLLGVARTETGFPSYRTLRDGVADALTAPLRWAGLRARRPAMAEFWALRDVSFRIGRGEAVGIIGRNGAGKSTLLKVLSRISRPSKGEVAIRGRIGSLLEVGTSFHPELTGRENIFLNGSILGMKRAEIRARFDEIVEFAEISQFLDTPVKRYSSGMFIRLAFAVAAHLEPEILLIDEVLAVGDAAFQKKCLGRMESGSRDGRTVLFVSHNMAALQRLCDRAIWLDRGAVVADGPAPEVVSSYLRTSFSPATERVWAAFAEAPGNDDVRLRRAAVRPSGGTVDDPVSVRTPVTLEFEYWNLKPGAAIGVTLHLLDDQGGLIFRSTSARDPEWQGRPLPRGLIRSSCVIPGDLLNDGSHTIEILFRKNEGLTVYQHDSLLTFDVLDDPERRGDCHGDWPGAVRPELAWSTAILPEELPEAGA